MIEKMDCFNFYLCIDENKLVLQYSNLSIYYEAADSANNYQNPTHRPGLFQSCCSGTLAKCNDLCLRGWPLGHESQVVLQLKTAATTKDLVS